MNKLFLIPFAVLPAGAALINSNVEPSKASATRGIKDDAHSVQLEQGGLKYSYTRKLRESFDRYDVLFKQSKNEGIFELDSWMKDETHGEGIRFLNTYSDENLPNLNAATIKDCKKVFYVLMPAVHFLIDSEVGNVDELRCALDHLAPMVYDYETYLLYAEQKEYSESEIKDFFHATETLYSSFNTMVEETLPENKAKSFYTNLYNSLLLKSEKIYYDLDYSTNCADFFDGIAKKLSQLLTAFIDDKTAQETKKNEIYADILEESAAFMASDKFTSSDVKEIIGYGEEYMSWTSPEDDDKIAAVKENLYTPILYCYNTYNYLLETREYTHDFVFAITKDLLPNLYKSLDYIEMLTYEDDSLYAVGKYELVENMIYNKTEFLRRFHKREGAPNEREYGLWATDCRLMETNENYAKLQQSIVSTRDFLFNQYKEISEGFDPDGIGGPAIWGYWMGRMSAVIDIGYKDYTEDVEEISKITNLYQSADVLDAIEDIEFIMPKIYSLHADIIYSIANNCYEFPMEQYNSVSKNRANIFIHGSNINKLKYCIDYLNESIKFINSGKKRYPSDGRYDALLIKVNERIASVKRLRQEVNFWYYFFIILFIAVILAGITTGGVILYKKRKEAGYAK